CLVGSASLAEGFACRDWPDDIATLYLPLLLAELSGDNLHSAAYSIKRSGLKKKEAIRTAAITPLASARNNDNE
ncbi:hypothetical protein, partial [Acinetobacter nosocomialis]|uniref:hypothetical protein n=1 Tax=Acinetobacter nosocomialis TaxID=106654 RepID=UPI001C07E5BB